MHQTTYKANMMSLILFGHVGTESRDCVRRSPSSIVHQSNYARFLVSSDQSRAYGNQNVLVWESLFVKIHVSTCYCHGMLNLSYCQLFLSKWYPEKSFLSQLGIALFLILDSPQGFSVYIVQFLWGAFESQALTSPCGAGPIETLLNRSQHKSVMPAEKVRGHLQPLDLLNYCVAIVSSNTGSTFICHINRRSYGVWHLTYFLTSISVAWISMDGVPSKSCSIVRSGLEVANKFKFGRLLILSRKVSLTFCEHSSRASMIIYIFALWHISAYNISDHSARLGRVCFLTCCLWRACSSSQKYGVSGPIAEVYLRRGWPWSTHSMLRSCRKYKRTICLLDLRILISSLWWLIQ